MARKVKDKWLGARVDEDLSVTVSNYLQASDLNLGDLVREGVKEYMLNHPVKPPQVKEGTLYPELKKLQGKDI